MTIDHATFVDAAQRLHGHLLRTHWNGQAVAGPDPGIRLNARFGRFIKSYLSFIPWKDDIVYFQGQKYWISSNWRMTELGVGDAAECRNIATRCAQFLLDGQAAEGYWPYPNREWKNRIATVEGNYGAIALAETYNHTGDERFLAGAKKWYRFATTEIGFQNPNGHLAINYFARKQGEIVPNVSASALHSFARLADSAGDDQYLEHSAAMVAFLRDVQLKTGELPYAIASAVTPGSTDRTHFLCHQYNAFELMNLAMYFELTGDEQILPVIENLGRFVASGITESGALHYDCHHARPEVPYYGMAAATALNVATQMNLGDYAELSQRAYQRVLSLQKSDGSFVFHSTGNYGFLSDRRSYPRYLSMILFHLLMAVDSTRGCTAGGVKQLEENAA